VLCAQGERALALRPNVVRVLSGRDNVENGFGFIVSESKGKLYIVTAYHVVASTPDAPSSSTGIVFFTNQGKTSKAECFR
jgi:hypothetical protein